MHTTNYILPEQLTISKPSLCSASEKQDGLAHAHLSSLPNAASLFVGLPFHENVERWSSEF
jgi:hypothetical protein